MPDFNNEQLILNLQPGPDLLYCSLLDIHRVLLIEFLIGVHSFLIDDDESFFPFSQHLRFFVNFPVNISVFYQSVWQAWDLLY